MHLHKKLFYLSSMVVLLGSTTIFASDQSAREILNKAYQEIGSMDAYAFTAVVTGDGVAESKEHKKAKNTVSVKVNRPGKLRINTKGIDKDKSFYLNDGTFTMIDHTFNFYAQIKTENSIDDALDMLFDTYAIKAPLAQLIYSTMDTRVKFTSSKYFGIKNVAGVECDYIAFKNGTREIHVWIARGERPLVKAYSIIDKDTNGASRVNTSIIWNENPNISDSDFVFVAPKGSSKISVNPAN